VADAHLYQDISQYLLNSKENTPTDGVSTVHMPIRAVAGDCQTGEARMTFRYEVKDDMSVGTEPRLMSSGSDGDDDDDDSCFIKTLQAR
jgi:hypothetical protein